MSNERSCSHCIYISAAEYGVGERFRGEDAQAVAMWLGESGISVEICGVFEGDLRKWDRVKRTAPRFYVIGCCLRARL